VGHPTDFPNFGPSGMAEGEEVSSVFVIVGEYDSQEDVKVLLLDDGKLTSPDN